MPDSGFFSTLSLTGVVAWKENPAKGLGLTSAFFPSIVVAGAGVPPKAEPPNMGFGPSDGGLGVPKTELENTDGVVGVVVGVVLGVPNNGPEAKFAPNGVVVVVAAGFTSASPFVLAVATANLGGEKENGAFVTVVVVAEEVGKVNEKAAVEGVGAVLTAAAVVAAAVEKLKGAGEDVEDTGVPKILPVPFVAPAAVAPPGVPKVIPEPNAPIAGVVVSVAAEDGWTPNLKLAVGVVAAALVAAGTVIGVVVGVAEGVVWTPNLNPVVGVVVGPLVAAGVAKEKPVLDGAAVDAGVVVAGATPNLKDAAGVVAAAAGAAPGFGVSQAAHLTASAVLLT